MNRKLPFFAAHGYADHRHLTSMACKDILAAKTLVNALERLDKAKLLEISTSRIEITQTILAKQAAFPKEDVYQAAARILSEAQRRSSKSKSVLPTHPPSHQS